MPGRRASVAVVLVLAMVAVATGLRAGLQTLQSPADEIPTTTVARGDIDTTVHATGELRSVVSETLSAPPAGVQLRILSMRGTGDAVAAGDPVVAFDPSEQEYRLEEQRSVAREAELEIAKLEAERDVRSATDRVELTEARYAVRRAELDVVGNDMLPSIDARKRELTLEEARRRLAQLEQGLGSRSQSSEAALAVAREKRNKARLAIAQAERLLGQMTLRATMAGVVSVKENREGNFFFWGMTFNEYRQGDTVSSGRVVAEVLAPARIEVSASVPEGDRSRVATGQRAEVLLDAGGPPLEAIVSHVGGISASDRFFDGASGPGRRFGVTFSLREVPETARPGQSARIALAGDPLARVLYVPRQAAFERAGKTVVYVREGGGFAPREVKVVSRTASVVVVEDIVEGTEVALADPTQTRRQPGVTAAGPLGVAVH